MVEDFAPGGDGEGGGGEHLFDYVGGVGVGYVEEDFVCFEFGETTCQIEEIDEEWEGYHS